MSSSSFLVEVNDLHKSYAGGEKPVLQGLNIKMHPGDRVVVIGPSGGGKSTLLRVLMGLESIDKGQILFQGQKYIQADSSGRTSIDKQLRQKIGMVFQHYTLFPHLNVLQNLVLAPIKVCGVNRKTAEDRARTLLNRFGLEAKAKEYPARLSGGQKQRVAIARALMLDPKLMLFDEVTSALDPELVAEVEQVIIDLAVQSMPMVIVTHDMHFAKNIASRVIFCAGGVVVEDGPPEQVLGQPREDRTKDFIHRVFHIGEPERVVA